LIADDSVLSGDFERLLRCVGASDPVALAPYENILRHLMAEIGQSAADHDRIADESPTCVAEGSDPYERFPSYPQLKDALERYRLKYGCSRAEEESETVKNEIS
jgi:hypothetical protein